MQQGRLAAAAYVILVLVTFPSLVQADSQCCVWGDLTKYVQNNDASGGLTSAPSSAPDSSCSGSYSWSSCSGKCLKITCQGTFQGQSGTKYAGICAPNGQTNVASTLQAGLQSAGGIGTCSQSDGVTPDSIPAAPEVPLTTTSVSSAAASGSVGGSIVGSLIAAFLAWVIPNLGPTVLKFLLGKMYDQLVDRFNAWRKPKSDGAAHHEGDQNASFSAKSDIVTHSTPTNQPGPNPDAAMRV